VFYGVPYSSDNGGTAMREKKGKRKRILACPDADQKRKSKGRSIVTRDPPEKGPPPLRSERKGKDGSFPEAGGDRLGKEKHRRSLSSSPGEKKYSSLRGRNTLRYRLAKGGKEADFFFVGSSFARDLWQGKKGGERGIFLMRLRRTDNSAELKGNGGVGERVPAASKKKTGEDISCGKGQIILCAEYLG